MQTKEFFNFDVHTVGKLHNSVLVFFYSFKQQVGFIGYFRKILVGPLRRSSDLMGKAKAPSASVILNLRLGSV